MPDNIPAHVAVIMDGNGRWAKKKGAARIFGHTNAIRAVRDITEASAELGVKFLTLYAFSTENWSRPREEINALMELLVRTISSEIKTLEDNRIRLNMLGNVEDLPSSCQSALKTAMAKTSKNNHMTLNLALSYSGRWDILQATRKIANEVAEGKILASEIDEAVFASHLCTAGMPDPELLIRTSGEMRVSNYLLWQIAYTELHITDVLWPDFRKEHFYTAIADYQSRERRFGKTSEQLLVRI